MKLQQPLAEKITSARKAADMTQQELAEALGEKHGSTVSAWEHGAAPSANKLMRIAEALSVSPNYLLGWHEEERFDTSPAERKMLIRYRELDSYGQDVVNSVLNIEHRRVSESGLAPVQVPTRLINIYPLSVSAGRGIDLVENFPEPITIPKDKISERADFVLRVAGDSMEPEYSDGDLILIRQTPAIDPGTLGVFGLNGEGYFKKLGEKELVSLNPEYNPIPLNESLICFGEVLGKTKEV